MRKSFIAAAIIGFATLGTANASEVNQNLNFMTDHEMHDVSGAKLKSAFSWHQAMNVVDKYAKKRGLRYSSHERLEGYARRLIASKTVYDRKKFTNHISKKAFTLHLAQKAATSYPHYHSPALGRRSN